MEKSEKLELIQRSLALKHKLKVHDTLPPPDTHEQIAVHYWARWELEDELRAIEQIIDELRTEHVAEMRDEIMKKGVKKPKKLNL